MTPKNILPFPILEINALIVSLLHWPLQVKLRLCIHTWFLCISPSSFIIILLLSWADFSYADVESFYALFILPSCQNHTLMGSSPTQISNNIPKQEAMAFYVQFSSVQFSHSVVSDCDPMNRSTPGLPVHHQLPEFTQTHAHCVGDAIQPSHPLSSPSPPAPNPS